MGFVNDRKSYALCFFFNMCFYLASGKGIVHDADARQSIFPDLGRDGGKHAADDITKMLRKFVGVSNLGIHDDPSSKDLRYGPVTMMMLHPQGGAEIATSRGGWKMEDVFEKKIGALVFYLTVLEQQVIQGGKILGGYDDIYMDHMEPKLSFLCDDNRQLIDNFLYELFRLADRSPIFFNKNIQPMLHTCFASFLLWLKEVR